MNRRDLGVWCVAALVLAFFAVGGWYAWHADSPTLPATSNQPAPSAAAAKAAKTATDARRHAAPGSTRIMVVGNSVAHFLAQAMAPLRETPPIAVFDDAILGCEFPPQIVTYAHAPNGAGFVPTPPCSPPSESVALANFRPAIALWIPADFYGVGGQYHGATVRPCSRTYDDVYRSDLVTEVRRLASHGARVVLATQAYERGSYFHHTDPAIDCDNRIVRAVAEQAHTGLVDLFDYVCPHGTCKVRVDGVVLRPDGEHYQGAGADVVARWIAAQITG